MKTTQRTMFIALATAMLFGTVGCAELSRAQNTAVGAGVGAVGGAVLTGGNPAAVVGGAVVGGVIGHEADKTKK